MHTAELIRWAAVAAMTAAVIRFPRPTVFWSLGARRPFVLARVRPDGPSRFRAAAT